MSADAPITEEWVPVAIAPGGDPGRSLQPIYDVLVAAEIPAGFDPYRPGDASNPYPSPQRAFKVVVPESLRDRAFEVIREAGIALPGESRSDVLPRDEPTPTGDHSDRVLDEDVRDARDNRFRRTIAIALIVVLISAVALTLYLTFGHVFGSLPPAVP